METCPNCQKNLDNMEAKLEFCSACQWDSDDDEPENQPPSSLIQWTSLEINDEVMSVPVLNMTINKVFFVCCIGLDEKLDSLLEEMPVTVPNSKTELKGRISDVMSLKLRNKIIETLNLYQWPFEEYPNPVLITLTKQ